MRKKERALEPAGARGLMEEADFGFLGLAGSDGQPYVVPVNHVVVDGNIVFHCALEGHKLDLIRQNPRVCYSVCTEHEVLPDEISTRYRSAIAFGRAEIVEGQESKRSLLEALLARLAPDRGFKCGGETIDHTCVVRIRVEKLTGKGRA